MYEKDQQRSWQNHYQSAALQYDGFDNMKDENAYQCGTILRIADAVVTPLCSHLAFIQ